jgi:hypothetical protein
MLSLKVNIVTVVKTVTEIFKVIMSKHDAHTLFMSYFGIESDYFIFTNTSL